MYPENKIYWLFPEHLDDNKKNLIYILSYLSNTTKTYVLINSGQKR